MRAFNPELTPTRTVTDETCAFGFACYEGEVRDGEFHGDCVGNIAEAQDAKRWLKGDDIDFSVVPKHPGKSWV